MIGNAKTRNKSASGAKVPTADFELHLKVKTGVSREQYMLFFEN